MADGRHDGVVMIKNLPFSPDLIPRAKELRKHSTLSEVLLWNKLKNKQFLELDFDRQKIIGNYIVDLYCPELDFVIEIDGCSHDWQKSKYDMTRHNYLTELGLYVLHIDDKDVKQKMDAVIGLLQGVVSAIRNGSAAPKDSSDWFVNF